jgi:hypothetical protein
MTAGIRRFVAQGQRKGDAFMLAGIVHGPWLAVIYNAHMHTMKRRPNALAWAWIACLAILFNAFVPLVSHAMGAPAAAGASAMAGMEVCTALGMRTMVSSDPDPDAGKLQKTLNHCGYCAVHAATYGLPPPMTAGFAPAAGRDAWPPLYDRSSRVLFSWALAQPRAPPVVA